MNAGIYIRVSTREQAQEGYSVGSQTEKLKAYCTAKDWEIYKLYIDPGFSGSSLKRPALQQMLNDIAEHRLDIVLVKKLDRLSRSQKDTLYLIEDVFLKNNVSFVSMEESFDTSTAFGRATIGILSVFAQLERDMIKERTNDGRIERAKEGYYHGGSYAPVGYDYIDGKLIVNEYEALQVREIFSLFNNGYTINYIQKYMSANYRNKYSSWNSARSISNCLRNSVYIGKVKFNNEYNGIHEAIIDEAAFNEANKRLGLPENPLNLTASQRLPFKSKEILSGIVYCARCKAKYFCNHGKYSCYSRAKSSKKFITDPNCKNNNWPVKTLNDLIENELLKLDFYMEYTNTELPESSFDPSIILQSELSNIDKQINRLLELLQHGELAAELVSERIEMLYKDRKNTLRQLEYITDNDSAKPAEADNLARSPKIIISKGSIFERHKFITELIKRIELDGDTVTIYWNFNPE